MNDMKKYLVRYLTLLGMLTLMAGCGDGSSSSSSQTDPGTPTTLVTAANGVSTQICAPNAQCISPLFAKLAQVSNKLSIAATPWTNTTTNIITISKKQ
jgi:ABC-type phosphate transport system substrate-binding protein